MSNVIYVGYRLVYYNKKILQGNRLFALQTKEHKRKGVKLPDGI